MVAGLVAIKLLASRSRAEQERKRSAGVAPPPDEPLPWMRNDDIFANEFVDPMSEDWSDGRGVCPCCECVTDYGPRRSCSVCDWEEPLAPNPDWEVADSERSAMLAEARERYAATGSAITDEERASWGGELTPREVELRAEVKRASHYLRTGDRPDATEAWERLDALLAELREEADAKRRDTE